MEVHQRHAEPWRVTLVDTGENTQTGGRLKRVARLPRRRRPSASPTATACRTSTSRASIALPPRARQRLATVTAVQPPGRFGALDIDGKRITRFEEKPQGDGGWINGGFFVLDARGASTTSRATPPIWEREPLERLAARRPALGLHPPRLLAADGHAARQDAARGAVAVGRGAVEGLGVKRDLPFAVSSLSGRSTRCSAALGRRVLVTGHTGFKGAWLALWLQALGADVCGLALPAEPGAEPSATCSAWRWTSALVDLRDGRGRRRGAAALPAGGRVPPRRAAAGAAQLPRAGRRPSTTNVMGTVHLLEAVRGDAERASVVVNVTTDKCYRNRECARGYREDDALGGHDPYSASKACAELVAASYRAQLPRGRRRRARHGARRQRHRRRRLERGPAGSRPGARGRRAASRCAIRYPQATRPWQHVLEPLAGYLMLGERLLAEPAPTPRPGTSARDAVAAS